MAVSPAGIVSRFAPSPTGFLHLGHAFSAILAHDRARSVGGRFLLRIEDIDTGRCRPMFVEAILEDLQWLGLAWDASPLIQSTRHPSHGAALARLEALGLTYPCFCTRADIAAAATAPHGASAVYPGTCRALPRDEATARATAGPHAIRLNVGAAEALAGHLTWEDTLRGTLPARPGHLGDVVLARKDIGVGYMLAAVVDDAAQGVTDVVRGSDLFEASHVQRLLQALLGLPAPRYLHHRLLLAADGRRLAKRDHAETLAALRARGVSGAALAATLRGTPALGADCHVDVT
ncbi:MAG: tRNA glutamyl-Q(34) synthetase GluQRS [Thermaurantiacus sp.]